ncbi:supervillin-like isoform X2 [Ctenocephalides felis]|nr:supervillin-like isoform X2 [Ctenocephalides felis]
MDAGKSQENVNKTDPESDDNDESTSQYQSSTNSIDIKPGSTRNIKSATTSRHQHQQQQQKLKEDSGIQDDCSNMLLGSCPKISRTSKVASTPNCDKQTAASCSDSPIDEGVASDLSSDDGRRIKNQDANSTDDDDSKRTLRENSKNLELSSKKTLENDNNKRRKMTRTERTIKSFRIPDDDGNDVRSKLEILLKKGAPILPQPKEHPQSVDGDGEEVRRVGRNDAVARRRQANAARKEASLGRQPPSAIVKTKSSSSIVLISKEKTSSTAPESKQLQQRPEICDEVPSTLYGLRRSQTQPLREPWRESRLKSSDEEDNEMPGGATIAERLAALKKSGQNDWRKRVSRLAPDEDVSAIISRDVGKPLKQEPLLSSPQPACILPPPVLQQQQQQQQNQFNSQQSQIVAQQDSRAAVLAERLECLETASQGWRRRVAPADAGKFSVAGRMPAVEKSRSMLAVVAGAGGAGTPTSNDQRKRRCPPMNRFRSRTAISSNTSPTATGPSSATQLTSTVSGSPFKRSISAPGAPEQDLNSDTGGVSVPIPRTDDETFNAFFLSATETPPSNNSSVEIDSVDLDAVSKDARQMLVLRRTVQAQRGRRAGSRNPVRALAQREDLRDSYAEVRTDVADRELKRMKVEKLAKGSSMAVEALAGLASKEDFTAVNLRKAAASASFTMVPHKPLMLIQVKGRRHVQARLVEPVASSINSGDAYVLVTPDEVYLYLGLYSNVIERSRGADIVQCIQQKKDLGCSSGAKVYTINEEKVMVGQSVKKFWTLLGCPEGGKPVKAGHPDEDELYESGIVDTNMAYELQGDELVPLEKYWGSIPRISMLDPSKILVFDFGSEMYVWNGKTASIDDRKSALKLAQELWAEGYDYSNCDVCPLNVTELLGDRGMRDDDVVKAKKSDSRPEWALIGKINQHMETVLFREKFLDWPDFSRVIQSKTLDNGEEKSADATIDLSPCNAKTMIDTKPSLPSLKLETDEVGRGDFHFNEELGKRCEITTVKVTVWRVQEYKSSEFDDSKIGHFYSGDGYVVRWQYLVSVTGRELGGKPSRHSLSGRDRCAYFCWQGRTATNIDKGAAALMTVQLDKERGPQIRVAQGREPPAFVNLFSGGMIVHEGKRGETRSDRYRLYTCRGCVQNEAVLEEVPCSMRQLRSRASLVLVDTENNTIVVWHGARSLKHVKEVARAAATRLQNTKPQDLFSSSTKKVTLSETTEGNENNTFLEALGGCNRKLYVSMIKSTTNTFDYTPRLFHLSSISGTFEPTEILCPLRHDTLHTPFPFSQRDLYSVSQPAIFLLDNESSLWLWQGWWPPGQDMDDDTDSALLGSDQTGSGAVRWQAERRAAMQTAVDYWKVKHGSAKDVKGYLVWAGLEPLEFTNLFPVWQDRDDIAEINMKEGKKAGEPISLQGELSQLTCSTYHPDILLQRPLPEGVDPTRLELYLEPRYFKELLGLTKEEFNELPTWKQTKVKKDKGLF